jgi:anti-sigma-K factor RskA
LSVPEPDPPPTVTAAELALGLLDGDERAAALRRVLADRAFAVEVERWRDRFGDLHALSPEADPPADGLARVDAAIDGSEVGLANRRAARWRATAIAASLVAALLFGTMMLRPGGRDTDRQVTTAPALLVASIKPTDSREPIAVAYDPATKRLSVASAALTGSNKSAELWVIADGAKPRSVGLLAPNDPTNIRVRDDLAPLFKPTAELAISIEPLGGSPTGQATGPVVAAGFIS